jgi:hypothetical protein
MVEVKFYGN